MQTKLLSFSLLLLSFDLAFGQDGSNSRVITADFKSGSYHNEQAVQSLIATNKLEVSSRVEYKAGQSITLKPGFEAKSGSSFVAHIGEVSIIATVEGQSEPLQITAYPNPYDETTTISYTLTRSARISLYISDTKGSIVGRLVDNQMQESGRHDVEWKGGLLSAGTYICILDADQQRASNRMVRK